MATYLILPVPTHQPVCRRVVVRVVYAGALHHQEEALVLSPLDEDVQGLGSHVDKRGCVILSIKLVIIGHMIPAE